jgi:hypothetical protein
LAKKKKKFDDLRPRLKYQFFSEEKENPGDEFN